MNRAKRLENYTLKAKIGKVRVFATIDMDRLGGVEGVWVDCHLGDSDAEVRSWANAWALAFTKALRAGCPLDSLVDAYLFTRFEPAGLVRGGSGRVKMATSIPDWLCREIGIAHLGREELALA